MPPHEVHEYEYWKNAYSRHEQMSSWSNETIINKDWVQL